MIEMIEETETGMKEARGDRSSTWTEEETEEGTLNETESVIEIESVTENGNERKTGTGAGIGRGRRTEMMVGTGTGIARGIGIGIERGRGTGRRIEGTLEFQAAMEGRFILKQDLMQC